jgi:hypothetical protein
MQPLRELTEHCWFAPQQYRLPSSPWHALPHWQVPDAQYAPGIEHCVPHAPQLLLSEAVLVQVPLQ